VTNIQHQSVAVLMPFKNAARFIVEAVASVLDQTHRDVVLFAINDHSDDESESVIRSINDDRIRVLQSAGHGVSAALNEGLRHCGPYTLIARQDADDISFPTRIARQFAFMIDNQNVGVLATRARCIDERGAFLRDFPATPAGHSEIISAMKSGNPICHGSVMMRTAVLQAAGGYNTDFALAQGYELWVRLASDGAIFAALPDVLYQYRSYPASWSESQTPRRVAYMDQIQRLAQSTLP
jgi:glycosyltransferase involved in cell wall biosynthesis